MTRQAVRSFRLRPPSLHEILHVLAFAGVLLVLLGALLSLQEQVHAFGHTPHKLTLLARIMGDCSPVPMLLAIFIAITAAEVLFVASWADPRRDPNRSVARWALVFSVCLFFLAVFTAALWVSDMHDVEYEPYYGDNPFLLSAQTSFLLYSLGAVAFFLLYCVKRPMLAVLAFALPAPFLARIIASPLARAMLRDFGKELSPVFPAILPTLLVAGGIVGVCLVLLRLRTGIFASDLPAQHIVAITAALFYTQFSLASLAFLLAFQHLCMTDEYEAVQWKAAGFIALAFVVGWAVIAIAGYIKRRRHRRYQGEESARETLEA